MSMQSYVLIVICLYSHIVIPLTVICLYSHIFILSYSHTGINLFHMFQTAQDIHCGVMAAQTYLLLLQIPGEGGRGGGGE